MFLQMIEIFTIVAGLLSVIAGFFALSKTSDKSIKILLFFFLISFIVSLGTIILVHKGISNIFTFHLFPIVELILLLKVLTLWDKKFKKVYITIGIVIGLEVLIDSIITPFNQVPIESIMIQKIVLAVLFARLMIFFESIDISNFRYLIIIALTIDFSAGASQIVFFMLKLSVLPLYSYPIMYIISLLISSYALFMEYMKNKNKSLSPNIA